MACCQVHTYTKKLMFWLKYFGCSEYNGKRVRLTWNDKVPGALPTRKVKSLAQIASIRCAEHDNEVFLTWNGALPCALPRKKIRTKLHLIFGNIFLCFLQMYLTAKCAFCASFFGICAELCILVCRDATAKLFFFPAQINDCLNALNAWLHWF